jgi:hypothetical protein
MAATTLAAVAALQVVLRRKAAVTLWREVVVAVFYRYDFLHDSKIGSAQWLYLCRMWKRQLSFVA